MKTFNIDDTNEYLNEAYKKDNYKVEYTEANTGRYIIFFSGNGLYYPDTVESFENTVLKKDRYEWTNTAKDELVRHYFERIIFVRDIYKCWYGKGINENCDSIDKVVELCKDLVGG